MIKTFLRNALQQSLDASALTPLTPLVQENLRRVITSDTLSREVLVELFAHRCCAIRIPNFYPKPMLPIMQHRLLSSDHRTNWQVSDPQRGLENSNVESVGTPLTAATLNRNSAAADTTDTATNATDNTTDHMAHYFLAAQRLTRELRAAGTGKDFAGTKGDTHSLVMTPMDKLRLELDEEWPGGARVGRDKNTGRALLAGCGRIMHSTSSTDPGFCHVDDIAIMKETSGTFSANVYLETPPVGLGGELNIWPIQINSRLDFYTHSASLSLLLTQEKSAQEALRRCLPPPITIVPEPGDLIMICAQRPHAVVGFDAGRRVSMQTFVEVDGLKHSLMLES